MKFYFEYFIILELKNHILINLWFKEHNLTLYTYTL